MLIDSKSCRCCSAVYDIYYCGVKRRLSRPGVDVSHRVQCGVWAEPAGDLDRVRERTTAEVGIRGEK